MPVCKNDPKKTYTGKEPSPLGLGYSPRKLPERTRQIGKDGNTWIVLFSSDYKRKYWSKMKVCKNDPKKMYTGKEPSPLGLGYVPGKFPDGTKKMGKDGNMWIVGRFLDGRRKIWITMEKYKQLQSKEKQKDMFAKLSLEQKYGIRVKPRINIARWSNGLSATAIKNLKKIAKIKVPGIRTLVIPFPKSDNGYYMTDYVYNKMGGKAYDIPINTIAFVIPLDETGSRINDQGTICDIYHNIEKSKMKATAVFIKKEFGRKVSWGGKTTQLMYILA